MRKLLHCMTTVTVVAFLVIIVIILGVFLGVSISGRNATEAAIQKNMITVLDETSEESYELLLKNDWDGFEDYYDLKTTYYMVGDTCRISLTSDRMMETIVIYAGTTRDQRVTAIAVQGYGEHWEGFDTSEPYSVLVAISGHPIYFTATGAASLCYNLTRVTSD